MLLYTERDDKNSIKNGCTYENGMSLELRSREKKQIEIYYCTFSDTQMPQLLIWPHKYSLSIVKVSMDTYIKQKKKDEQGREGKKKDIVIKLSVIFISLVDGLGLESS